MSTAARGLILVLGLSLFLLAGCGSDTGSGLDYNFKQGTAGLQLKLLENAPPEQIYPLSQFKMVLELDNQAAYDVRDGVVSIVGLDEKYFKVLPREQSFEVLAGRSLTTPNGEKVFLEFDGTAGDLFQNAEQYVNTYFVKASYNTEMEFVDTVCLNPSLYEVYDAGCKVKDHNSYGGQGAPLAVTEMQQIMYPGTSPAAEFRFRLQNRGGGLSRVGYVTVEGATLGGVPLRCVFLGAVGNPLSIQMDQDRQEALLVCSAALRDQRSYETALALDLTYDYQVSIQKELRLINPLRQSRLR